MTEPSSNSGDLLFNSEEFKDLLHNATSLRTGLLNKFLDPRRDYDKECGYPKTEEIRIQDYKRMYDRDPIAARIVDCLPDECWKVQPTVYEEEDNDTVTEFEEAWDNLGRTLKDGSFYQDEESSPVWEYLNRLDRLCGIGSFGVLLLGLDDLKEGDTLEKPAPGFEEDDDPTIYSSVDGQRPEGSSPQRKEGGEEAVPNLVFLRVFDESLVQITQYDSRKTSKRFGQPLMYQLTFVDPNDQSKGGVGLPLAVERVHWSRIIHVADNLNSSEIFGDPRMRTNWNRLIDLTKLYGGSAEMYWKGAFPGLSLNIDPKMDPQINPIDSDGIREAMWKYSNSLQRWFALTGVSVQTLATQVVDPTQQINIHLEAICVKLAIPKRIFLGSERGELSSAQDVGSWNGRLKHRQKTFITPKIIIPFVDRLIKLRVLPQPKGYSVTWPELEALSPETQATVANSVMSAITTYIAGGAEVMIEPIDFYTRILKMSEEEAKAILDNRSQSLEEKKAQEQEQAEFARVQELESQLEEPEEEPAPDEELPPEE